MNNIIHEINEDIKPLTIDDYKKDLADLKSLKFEKINYFDLKSDNKFKEVVGNKPKYVEFGDNPYPYDKALVKAVSEIYDMFKDCSSYEDARKVITTIDPLNLCSEDRNYYIIPNTTGKFYGCWMVLWGYDDDKTIKWDVRWY